MNTQRYTRTTKVVIRSVSYAVGDATVLAESGLSSEGCEDISWSMDLLVAMDLELVELVDPDKYKILTLGGKGRDTGVGTHLCGLFPLAALCR